MRATLSGYYRNLQFDQNNTAKKLFDVTKQISSGQKIQYAYEDNSTFINTVRLDNEITTLTQVKQNSQSALQFSTNTDTTMNDMTKVLESMKVKLVSASNETNSQESLNALAAELRGLEKSLIDLANTSIDGKYLFSGTDIQTKPIDSNGIYQGNNKDMKTFIGSGVEQTYNINGADLFLGDENDTQRKISLNVPLFNQTVLYPDVMVDSNLSRDSGTQEYITGSSAIRDLMGDTDANIDNITEQHHFYIQGTNHEGVSFKQTISMRDDESVDDLLIRIGEAYGNTPSNELVRVSINNNGQIEIEDKRSGSSKLDFHMVANTDANGPATDTEELNTNTTNVRSFMKSDYTQFVSDIGQRQDIYDNDRFELSSDFLAKDSTKSDSSTLLSSVLQSDVDSIYFTGTDSAGNAVTSSFTVTSTSTMQDLMDALDNTYDANVSGASSGDLLFSIKDGKIIFNTVDGNNPSINMQSKDANGNIIRGLPSDASVAFDESEFKKDGNKVLSNVSQVVKADNSYATGSTKLIDVADITQGTSGTLDGSNLNFSGIDINGNRFDVIINLDTSGSTFAFDTDLDGIYNNITYDIFTATDPRSATPADEVTYQQLLDVMNMITTDNLPLTNTAADYDNAISDANLEGEVSLSYDGKIGFEEKGVTETKASFALFDENASDFTADASILTFQSNNALEIVDPKTDFFKQIDEAISSVEAGRVRADGTLDDPRNIGIQNAIASLDDLSAHLFNQHSIAGVNSQTLQATSDRTDLLMVATQTLRSQTIDIDLAEASLELKQLELNYEASLSTVSRITQLTLVNYL